MSHKTILSREGYIINKKLFTKNEIEQIRKELTVVPFTPCIFGNKKPEEFVVFKENDNYLCLPKYYGLNKLGKPDLIDEKPGESVDLQFKGELRDYQKSIEKIAMDEINKNDGGCISIGCGKGKCLGIDTLIMMYDGSTKKVTLRNLINEKNENEPEE